MLRTCEKCGTTNRVPAKHLAHAGRCGQCQATLPPLAEPIEVNAADFNDVIHNATVPVLVDFWAPWCGPCRMAAPEVALCAASMAGKAIVLKVNTENEPQLAGTYNVRGIPNFAVFKNGNPVQQQAGLVDHRQMQQWLAQAA